MSPASKLPDSAHTSRPWRSHALADDFELLDVWALPTPGGPDDFPKLVRLIAEFDPSKEAPRFTRMLFAARLSLGQVFGWDREPDSTEATSLRSRLPDDLNEVDADIDFSGLPFTPVYFLHDEFAAEVVNRTVHGILHLGWVKESESGYRGQLAVLVKPHGFGGRAYLAAIQPFRHLVVYPDLMRSLESRWQRAIAAEK